MGCCLINIHDVEPRTSSGGSFIWKYFVTFRSATSREGDWSIGDKEWQEGEEVISDWWKTPQYQSRVDTLHNALLKFLSKNWPHQEDFLYTCSHLVAKENVSLSCISYANKVKWSQPPFLHCKYLHIETAARYLHHLYW